MLPYLDVQLEFGILSISTELWVRTLAKNHMIMDFDLIAIRFRVHKWKIQFGLYYPERRWRNRAKRQGWVEL